MRIGIVLDGSSWEAVRDEVDAAENAGLDLCWLEDTGGTTASVAAAALAPVSQDVRVIAEIPAGSHPIGLAEELAVTDQLLGGRLTAVLTGQDRELVQETLDMLELALGGTPFRHDGARWTVPRTPDGTVRVTPAPAQLDLPLWLRGPTLSVLADEQGLPWVSESLQPRSSLRGRRSPAVIAASLGDDGELNVGGTVAALQYARNVLGVDTCALRLPDEPAAVRLRAIAALGARVRPRLQLAELPDELVDGWDAPDR